MTTHERVALRLGVRPPQERDHVLVLDSGRVADSGHPAELLASPGSPTTTALVEAAELGTSHQAEETSHG
ncbi:hypothetical protein [Lentzea cavernae]|uniref:hypothetical protein n=1 Tax=Lentzea cavernae TaxID=2020703 RepID=UPI00174B038B|nr:hypothetical protein [Lentzea cavernae]